MTQEFRITSGLIDRSRSLRFQWNDRYYDGHPGDTLASALLANGVRLVGRSFKYHRPRGIFSAGSEEPNALVELGKGAHREPNTRATITELFDGLYATSQNHRGPLGWDLMAANDFLAPFLSAGFYYKTFMWPKAFWERLYEPAIRASAGLGRLSGKPDPDCYDKGSLHCDVLVIGAGAAGLSAALASARAGARVILADEDFRAGGRLLSETTGIEGMSGSDWADAAIEELSSMERVRIMPRTTVYGVFDHWIFGAVERKTDHLGRVPNKPRQVAWRVYARRAVLAAGATERPIAFGHNDRPGIMLAGAVRTYLNRFGVAPGKCVTVFCNNDDGLRTAEDLRAKGVEVARVIDTRNGEHIVDTVGRKALKSVLLNSGRTIPTDCLAVSGGWSPNIHLTCHHRNRPVWRDDIAAFVAGGGMPSGLTVAGAAAGRFALPDCLEDGHRKGAEAAAELGFEGNSGRAASAEDIPYRVSAFWHVAEGKARAWVDLQNDVTTKDISQAHQEGFGAVEHLKRYTTLGMATDQGKTSNLLGLAVLADVAGTTIEDTGTTIFRPPYSPVSIGAFAGRARGQEYRPTRLPPSHDWAEAHGADFVEAGQWLRAQWYRRPGESGWRDSVDREVRTVREAVGICDVSTLGKIEVHGQDAALFLDRIYCNTMATLPVGKVRYGLMLREDGFVFDDGTAARLSEKRFVVTTTTANAGAVFRHMDFARQCLWPGLDVHLFSTTDAWAQVSVAGPNSRQLLSTVVDDLELSNEAFPFMACAECTVFGGTPARLFRISFSGELAYELAVPARYGNSLMAALAKAGAEHGAAPYGTEALGVLRIEKGHAAGAELNGQTTALMLGLGKMVSSKKDAIGTVLSRREDMVREDGLRLVGLRPVEKDAALTAGAHFLRVDGPTDMAHDEGWMTSVAWSPTLGHSIGLGFLRNGHQRHGEIIRAYSPVRGQDLAVEVGSPHHLDPEGERQRG